VLIKIINQKGPKSSSAIDLSRETPLVTEKGVGGERKIRGLVKVRNDCDGPKGGRGPSKSQKTG